MIPAALRAAVGSLAPEPARTGGLLVQQVGPGHVHVDGRALVNMASNDYLGFARDARVLAAAHQALDD